MRLVHRRLVGRQPRPVPVAGVIDDHHPLGGPQAGVGLAARATVVVVAAGAPESAVAAAVPQCRVHRGVGHLPGVRVEEHLVRIEPVAVRVDVAAEPDPAARGPGGVVRPVAAPAAEGVERPVAQARDPAPPDAVGAAGQADRLFGRVAECGGVALEDDAGGRGGVHGHGGQARRRVDRRAQRPVRAGPLVPVDGMHHGHGNHGAIPAAGAWPVPARPVGSPPDTGLFCGGPFPVRGVLLHRSLCERSPCANGAPVRTEL
ncbi:hypothetical protein SDC9_130949 [bioreactor metagenome]|uniref:Uncharacterized protein n=1 Tax=bioreactor metagenome TaxID=1076179 RepID=A0A645D321_9ZZZZ